MSNLYQPDMERLLEESDRIITIADEAFGPFPAQTAAEAMSSIERGVFALRCERDAYRAMVADLLASAHPHPTEHPTMTKQWDRARELLEVGPKP